MEVILGDERFMDKNIPFKDAIELKALIMIMYLLILIRL
jgi:hypothetical protein